jgi:hypothetical protein
MPLSERNEATCQVASGVPKRKDAGKDAGQPCGATRLHVHDYPHMKIAPARLFAGVAILARGLEAAASRFDAQIESLGLIA